MRKHCRATDRDARRRRILAFVSDVPRGTVASYGQIAALAGVANGARQVGRVLRELPAGSAVPWHRIVTASGQLAFAADSDAWWRQHRRLVAEGVEFSGRRIAMGRYRWQPDLDELLWKPSARRE